MFRHIVSFPTILVVALAGCDRSDSPSNDGTAENTNPPNATDRPQTHSTKSLLKRLDGTRFVSKKQHEIGLGPNGEELGFWYVTFKGGIATWDYSDLQQSGTFTIAADGSIRANMGSDGVNGSFDTNTNELLWDGKWYKPEEPENADGKDGA